MIVIRGPAIGRKHHPLPTHIANPERVSPNLTIRTHRHHRILTKTTIRKIRHRTPRHIRTRGGWSSEENPRSKNGRHDDRQTDSN